MDDRFYDAIIVGGGPAGLTAALFLARARYRVLVVEREKFGGQITITADVVNYPGVLRGSGEEITASMRKQAQHFGAEFLLANVEQVALEGAEKVIRTSRGEYRAFGVILATGARPRSVGFEGEDAFKGRGVAYCATCDGEFFAGLDVFVVGGGFAAAEEAVFLTKYARKVTVLVRGDDFSCAAAVAEEAKRNEKVEIHYNTVVESVSGGDRLEHLRAQNLKTGERWAYSPRSGEGFGIFVFAGYEPATVLVRGQVATDEGGYIVTDAKRRTNLDGVYAAGDVCVKQLRQMVTATADGAIAATGLERYVAAMQKRTGRVPARPASAVSPVPEEAQPSTAAPGDAFLDDEIRAQLTPLFRKMARPLVLRLYLDERPISGELRRFADEMAAMTEKLSVEVAADASGETQKPCVRIVREGGEDAGIAFHGVPGGHEFNSFAVALYNASGPGQELDEETQRRIAAIGRPAAMKILVSLSCTMCPGLVTAAQRIAAAAPRISAAAYDLNHFPELRERYNVMSVPCLILDDEAVFFGKKDVPELLGLLEGRKEA